MAIVMSFRAAGGGVEFNILSLICIGGLLAMLFIWALTEIWKGWSNEKFRHAAMTQFVLLVALSEGFGRRDIRRYGAGYESSFVYHHAKRMVKPAVYIPCMLYLSWPTAVYPNLLLLPAAILLGIAVTVTTASFKKYL